MQKNPGQNDEANDLRTRLGEVVRRADLERAAGTPSRFVRSDPRDAGYEGVELAKAALAGDQAALDEFHALAGLSLPGVTEHNEGHAVRLVMGKIDEEIEVCQRNDEARAVFQAMNEGGYNSIRIDAAELVAWVLSPEGQAALARRGISVSALASAGSWRHDAPPRGVRCFVTWTGSDGRARPRVNVASVSPDYDEERWFSDGAPLHNVIAWMLAPEAAEDKTTP